ncbi:anthranilate phosphoribosyltransferase [Ureibacillus thermophilus]|uniref:anthranilate phosphoribosyltransferase n=1 Tax=Ureibacillus thermophilus TaxID=367743 RepID=UPI0036101690
MNIQAFTKRVQQKEDLSYDEMIQAVELIFAEKTPKEDIAEFLLALREKGETAEEVAALSIVMKSNAIKIPVPKGSYIDNCGTGGDGLHTFNISTTSAFVLASNGVKVAKHGNRKISSSSGSTDVLEALGIHNDFTAEESAQLLEQEGIAFLYAPNVHPKLKRIGEVRRAIGKPTIFNLVGPLTNPVDLECQLVGISRPDFVEEYAKVLRILGRKRAIVVSGSNGMDEASLDQKNYAVILENGEIKPLSINIEELGLQPATISHLRGGTPEENANILKDLLKGNRSPYYDAVVLNAALGFFAYGAVESLKDGVFIARDAIESGRAYEKLEAVIEFSQNIIKEQSR